jgi:F-box domain
MANSKYKDHKTTIDMLPDEVTKKQELHFFAQLPETRMPVFQLLTIIFNRINFEDHLRLSGVCKRWNDVVQTDVLFMRTVKFNAAGLVNRQTLMRTYKYVEFRVMKPWLHIIDYLSDINTENLQLLLKNAETVDIGNIKLANLDSIMHLCSSSLKVVKVNEILAYSTAWTFEHQTPVEVFMKEPCTGFLDHFKVITGIIGLVCSSSPPETFMTKYSALIKSLRINLDHSLDPWCQFENLKLEFLYLRTPDTSGLNQNSVYSFFKKQAPSLKAIKIKNDFFVDAPKTFWFDPMRIFLGNLESVVLKNVCLDEICLNDLETLPKLKYLRLIVRILDYEYEHFYLNIMKLLSLTEFIIINSSVDYRHAPKLRLMPNLPMTAMVKIKIFNFRMDFETFRQIAQSMPDLKELDFNVLVK